MRAIQVDRYGGPEVLEVAGVADPVAGPRQVVVEVAAADVLFPDCQIRGGWGEMFGAVPPYVPGNGDPAKVDEAGLPRYTQIWAFDPAGREAPHAPSWPARLPLQPLRADAGRPSHRTPRHAPGGGGRSDGTFRHA